MVKAEDYVLRAWTDDPSLSRDEIAARARKEKVSLNLAALTRVYNRLSRSRGVSGTEATSDNGDMVRYHKRDAVAEGVKSLRKAVEALGKEACYQILGSMK